MLEEEVSATVELCDPSWGLGEVGFSGDPRSEGGNNSRRGRA